MAKRLDESWKAWLQTNIARKCDPEQLFGILLKNDFALDSIRECMGDRYPVQSPLAVTAGEKAPADIDYEAISRIRLAWPDSGLALMKLNTDKVQLYVLDDFMNSAECDAITALIDDRLRPSTVTRQSRADKDYRTSRTSDLSLLKESAVESLDEKIARTLGIRLPYSEGTQGQRYEVGQEFKQHTDYFAPNTEEYKMYGGQRGNRTWTFMVYLNDVAKGGGTNFVRLNHVVTPRKGRALAWNNLYPSGVPNYDTLHAGLAVEEGYKVIITKWFRARGTGPMFYDN